MLSNRREERLGAQQQFQRHDHAFWHIDWPNKRVECEGVNYYCPFEERLGKIFRCYSVPVEKPGPKRYLDLYLANADKALTIVTEMYERVSKTGLPVRIIGAEPGYVPTGIFATFAREIGCDKDFDFISMSEGYANYMRAGRAGAVNSVTIARVSRPGDRRIPRLPDRTMFEDWMASRDFTDAQVGAVVKKAVGQRRGNQSGDSIGMLVCDRLRKRLAEHQMSGGTVICMFGKVLYGSEPLGRRGLHSRGHEGLGQRHHPQPHQREGFAPRQAASERRG